MSANDYITVPTHPRLLLQAHPSGEKLVTLHYIGDAEDLIAAGVATAEMLAPNQKKGHALEAPMASVILSTDITSYAPASRFVAAVWPMEASKGRLAFARSCRGARGTRRS
jgi:hypothetical protein